jgi:hypothetical protein
MSTTFFRQRAFGGTMGAAITGLPIKDKKQTN